MLKTHPIAQRRTKKINVLLKVIHLSNIYWVTSFFPQLIHMLWKADWLPFFPFEACHSGRKKTASTQWSRHQWMPQGYEEHIFFWESRRRRWLILSVIKESLKGGGISLHLVVWQLSNTVYWNKRFYESKNCTFKGTNKGNHCRLLRGQWGPVSWNVERGEMIWIWADRWERSPRFLYADIRHWDCVGKKIGSHWKILLGYHVAQFVFVKK